MLNDQLSALTIATDNLDHRDDQPPIVVLRDIHALSPPQAPRETTAGGSTISRRSSLSPSASSSENLPSMSTEFNALVLAGSIVREHERTSYHQLDRIREDQETNPLEIVPDNYNPVGPARSSRGGSERLALISSTSTGDSSGNYRGHEVSVHEVKKEEVESRIGAWQEAKIAKITNRLKREDAVINGWEGEQVQKASTWMKKVERKLEDKRAKAHEKMQNDIAKAHRKAEERRASSEAKRGTKVARVLDVANLMRAVGRAPVKSSFF